MLKKRILLLPPTLVVVKHFIIEFAIQHFFNKGKKVVYTTPIKALSNEKFNDLQQKYPDISFGILTGDIKFNPEDVIIMTTEIFIIRFFKKNAQRRCTKTRIISSF